MITAPFNPNPQTPNPKRPNPQTPNSPLAQVHRGGVQRAGGGAAGPAGWPAAEDGRLPSGHAGGAGRGGEGGASGQGRCGDGPYWKRARAQCVTQRLWLATHDEHADKPSCAVAGRNVCAHAADRASRAHAGTLLRSDHSCSTAARRRSDRGSVDVCHTPVCTCMKRSNMQHPGGRPDNAAGRMAEPLWRQLHQAPLPAPPHHGGPERRGGAHAGDAFFFLWRRGEVPSEGLGRGRAQRCGARSLNLGLTG